MGEFDGKRVLITGGGTGVGADMARAFADRGAQVLIGGRREAPLREVAKAAGIDWQLCDVTDEGSVVALFERIGVADIVIANAGQADSSPLARVEMDDWSRLIGVNLTGVYLCYREAARRMDQGWGRIISVASMAGLHGLAYAAPYTAAKHGVVGLTKALALEVARKGITVNAICPGYLDTELTDGSVAKIAATTGRSEDEARAILAAHNPMKRLITVEEVTSAALWLASDTAASVNGQAIAITGGT